ncbi:SLC13 family permease [Kaarinaea lacus]
MNRLHNWTDRRLVGLILGPLLFILMFIMPTPAEMSPAALAVCAVAILMATWWITEALPLAATALLPIVLFPLLGVMPTATVTNAYANHLIYLFMGGFLIAMAMQKWNLHKRIALHIIHRMGDSASRMVLGFMLATALLSMWISNTATTLMMLPIAMAVIAQLTTDTPEADDNTENRSQVGTAIMLSIAYAASIGGVATLIGTPPNAILAGVAESQFAIQVSFATWMLFGLPLSLLMLAFTWFYLTRIAYPLGHQSNPELPALIKQQLAQLGPMRNEEKWVLGVFSVVAISWILRGLLDIPALKGVSDASIAIAGALLLFIIPSNVKKREFLLDWPAAVKLPWDILILFGGGFALAQGFGDSGLTRWIIMQLSILQGIPPVFLILAITLVVIFLTEVTSNTATATLVLPMMGALAGAIEVSPLNLMVPAAVAASYAFMLPVATPPNAIVFSSRYVSIPQMARAGLWMNLVASGIITLFVMLLLPLIFS